ncbi:MAG: SufS family cysteine desulfurase [Firmicutes bacterium]|nr:SufS family cysteine desulfurase [Bacillota bacterium]
MSNPNWRQEFPQIKNGLVYLDSAAMSLKPQRVIDAIDHYYQDLSVNIHRGLYPISVEATDLYEQTREDVATYINSEVEEIVFTRGTTSSLNLVASSYGLANLNEGDEIIVSELEHHSSYLPWFEIAKKTKSVIKFVPLTKEGRITVDHFKTVLTEKTKIVALTYVSNVMGFITPVKEIVKLAHSIGAIAVIDGAQALPHLKVDVKELDLDFLAFSAHKMLGPTGVGILYGKKVLLDRMDPIEFGGDMNDDVTLTDATYKDTPYKFEAGTMPVAGIIAFSDTIEYFNRYSVKEIESYCMELHIYALNQLKEIEGIEIYNPNSDTAIISYNLKNVPPHDAVTYYADQNICMRAGQHCAKLVTRFLGIQSCLRVSFYLYNNKEDVDRFVSTTKEAISFFKNMGF